MKIVQQTPNTLILRVRPVLLWIGVAISVSAAIFLIPEFGKVTTFTCNRIESTNCKLVASKLLGLGTSSTDIPLNMLQGARVDESRDSDGSSYRVILPTSNGEVPFTSYYSSKSNKEEIASRIEEFVRNPQITSLKEEQDDRLWAYIIGGIFILSLIPLLRDVSVVTCVFDKTLDTLTLKRQGLFGTRVIQQPLGEIEDVQVEGTGYHRVTIMLRSGDRLPLTYTYTNTNLNFGGNQRKIVSRINSFLDLN